MIDVACFCGCLYSFADGAGACPRCGEVVAVTAGPASESTRRSRQEQPAAEMNGAGPERTMTQFRAAPQADRATFGASGSPSDLLDQPAAIPAGQLAE